MNPESLLSLDAWQASRLLQRRELRAEDLMRACLDRIAEREPQVQAFSYVAADAALARARELDAGPVQGLLHGLPLGVKDVFDTAAMPTAYGSPIYANHRPASDAAVVALCLAAGAVVVGKTATTEFATYQPCPTRNPHRLNHTPGGSSSGSAAAVADGMAPLALGTQTAGSIIRPASFCGVVGYKPSFGRVPRAGVKSLCESMDTVGGFGRSVRDVGLLGAVLLGDERLARIESCTTARVGLCRTPWWEEADVDTQQAFAFAEAMLAGCGANVEETNDTGSLLSQGRRRHIALPDACGALVAIQKDVMAHEASRGLADEHRRFAQRLSPGLRRLLDEGAAMSGADHAQRLAQAAALGRQVDALFDNVDVLLAPSAIGEAPQGLNATGDPLFCRPWTLLGLPCVHLPFTKGHSGLPVGLQLIGRRGEDHRLLATALWVHERLTQ